MNKRSAMVVAAGLVAALAIGGIALAAANKNAPAQHVGKSAQPHGDRGSRVMGLDTNSTDPGSSPSMEPNADLSADDSYADDSVSEDPSLDDSYADDSSDDMSENESQSNDELGSHELSGDDSSNQSGDD